MKKKKDYTIALLIALLLFAILTSCKKVEVREQGHQCKWNLCPYKGITPDHYGKSVAAYVGNNESDAYSLDILHLEFPGAEYEELETMLKED